MNTTPVETLSTLLTEKQINALRTHGVSSVEMLYSLLSVPTLRVNTQSLLGLSGTEIATLAKKIQVDPIKFQKFELERLKNKQV